jgi:hypothetical protein
MEKSIFSLPDKCEMKKGRFSGAQIVAILQQQASGQTVAKIVREHGLSEATFCLEEHVCWGKRGRANPAQLE